MFAVTLGDIAVQSKAMPETEPEHSRAPSMASIIEDYALIGDTQSAAFVGRHRAIDRACFPRFDSGACFAALLGNRDNGRWLIAPRELTRATRRRYRPESMVVETEISTSTGVVRV